MRKLAILTVALLAMIVATSFYIINIKMKLFKTSPVVIYDPYAETGGKVVGDTLTLTLTGGYSGTPFAIVLPTSPLVSSSKLSVLEKKNETPIICVDIRITSNVTFSSNIIDWRFSWLTLSTAAGTYGTYFAHGFGLVGIAVPESLFEKYGYNNSFPVAITVRYPTEDRDWCSGSEDCFAVVSLHTCEIVNSTYMKCKVYIKDVGYDHLLGAYIYFTNVTTLSIDNEKYFVYLLPKKDVEDGVEPFFIGTAFSWDVYEEPNAWHAGLAHSNETIPSGSSEGTLRLCMSYVGGSVGGLAYQDNGIYPVFGAYLQISPDSLPAQVNITVVKIFYSKEFLVKKIR